MFRQFTAACAVALAMAGAAILSAQQAPTFRSSLHVVEVHVTVRGSDDQLITGLTKDDFELYDNGKRREITVFSADLQPIAVALVLDHSGSVAGLADKITAAADAFVGKLMPGDRAAVNSLTFECQPLTGDQEKLRTILRSPMQADLGSPVWAGLDRTLTSLATVTGRRAVLLISDGDDIPPLMINPPPRLVNTSPSRPVIAGQQGLCTLWSDPSDASFADTAKRAQRDGVMIYTVTVDPMAGMSHDDDMKSMAKGSGGERFRLKQETDLAAAFERIIDELHHQYLLGFSPEKFDGTVHSLSVRVKRPGMSVRARESYASIDADQPPVTTAAVREPAKRLTDAEVEKAILDGASGQKAQASCMALGVFPKRPDETEAMAEVTFEGPIGVIMRMARDAKAARSTFGLSDVTPDMRAPVVQVSSEVKRSLRASAPVVPGDQTPASSPTPTPSVTTDPVVTPIPTPTPTPTATPTTIPGATPTPSVLSQLVSVRLRSKLLTEVLLRPIAAMSSIPNSFTAPALTPASRRVDRFDLNAFRALPGADVEVVVRSLTGPRYCTITAKDRQAIR